MFNFDGNVSGGGGINLGGRGGGRNRARGPAEESRSDFVKRQHKEREAREKKRIRERAATRIQALFRRYMCVRVSRGVMRQTFDKRYADIVRVGTVLAPDKKAKFVFHALVPMLRLFAFFFTPVEDVQRLGHILELVLLSAGQLDHEAASNIFRLALSDEPQRRSFLMLLEKLVAALIRVDHAADLGRLLLAMQAVLFKAAPDRLPVDAQKSGASVGYILRRTEALAVITRNVLPSVVRPQASDADNAERFVSFFCAGLEVCPLDVRSELLAVLFSSPNLGSFLLRASNRAEMRQCSLRLVDLMLATSVPDRVDVVTSVLAEELQGARRKAWLMNNFIDVLEQLLLANPAGRREGWLRWLEWIAWAKDVKMAVGPDVAENARLSLEQNRLTQATFVRTLLTALDRSEELLAACQLYFAAPDGARDCEPPPEVLQTLAFATPLTGRLFPTLVGLLRSNSIEDVFEALSARSFTTPEATRLRIFCVVYRLQLQPMYDYEFFGAANPLRMDEVQMLTPCLNQLAYHFVTLRPDRSTLPPAGKALRSGLTALLGALYNRHCRKPILQDSSAWIIPTSKSLLRRAPVVDLGGDEAEENDGGGQDAMDDDEDAPMETDEGLSVQAPTQDVATVAPEKALEAVLEEIPHVLPFQVRVSLLHNVILADQDQRRETRGPFAQAVNLNQRHQIRRNFLVEDGFAAFEGLTDEGHLRDVFRVEFIAPDGSPESGVDGGGLFKEFMVHICRTMFDPEFGLFSATDDQALFPAVGAFKVHTQAIELYVFLGKVVGKAIYEMFLLEPQFSRVFLNRLLGRINEVDDIAALDRELHRNMIKLKESDNVEDLDLTFSVSLSYCGMHEEIDLIPDGRNVRVTKDNLTRYFHLMANYRTNVQFQRHAGAFLRGLQCVIPLSWLKMFDPYELNILISGCATGFDVRDLMAHTVYSGGYQEDSPVIQWLWELLQNHMESEDMARFLMFATSCSRAPLLGFKTLYPKFCVHRVPDSERLPTASTCANLLKLPDYLNFEDLRHKLTQAIRAEAGFDLS